MPIERLNRADYPNIDPADIGEYPNVAYGSLLGIRAACIEGGAVALLTADITASATSFDVDRVDGFPATPFTVQIQEERLRVTNISTLTFTVTRGYDITEPVGHKKNKTVYEVRSSYVYLVANHPVKAINSVYIDSALQVSRFTAYTGQSGDSHTDYTGKAVIEFITEAHVAPQFNLDFSAEKEQGIRLEIRPEISSHKLLVGDTLANFSSDITLQSGETAFVQFPVGYGQIITQEYAVNITPADFVIDDEMKFTISVTENGILKAYTDEYDARFALNRSGGIWNDVLKIANQGKDILLNGTVRKIVTKKNERYSVGSDTNIATVDPAITLEKYGLRGQPSFAKYSASSPVTGATIVSQTHYAEVDIPAIDAITVARISAVDPTTNEVIAFRDYEFPPNAEPGGSMNVTHDGGGWDVMTKVTLNHYEIYNDEYSYYKTVSYTTPEIIGAAAYATSSGAKVVIGENITVDADFAVDESGDYGGSGTLIDRPDWVIKHFLITQKGAVTADIDSTSFAAAGTLYAGAIAGGYKLRFLWTPVFGEDEMAFESRSVVYMTAGKYYLDFLPDTAPAASITISQSDTIGRGFVFNHGKFEDLYNNYTARYGKTVSTLWAGVVTSIDAGNKHGSRYQQVDLPLISVEAMAKDVLDNILLQHQKLYKTINFTVSWKYQPIQIGDTFDIGSTDLHSGTKFFVEKLKINDDNTIDIEGREWW